LPGVALTATAVQPYGFVATPTEETSAMSLGKVKSHEGSNPFSNDLPSAPQVCVERTIESQEQCLDLKSSDEADSVGSVCLQVYGSPPELEITYKVAGNLALTQADFWFGNDISAMPVKRNGFPSVEKFPYFWCNSSGQELWRTKFPFNATEQCPGYGTYNLTAVAHARVEQRLDDGSLSKSSRQSTFAFSLTKEESTKMFSWVNLPIACGCSKYSNTIAADGTNKKPLLPSVAACAGQEMQASHECHQLTTVEQKEVGSVCIEIAGSPPMFEVTYKVSDEYALTSTDFWFNPDLSSLPLLDNGTPDVRDFNFYWRNSTGENEWSTKVPMSYYYGCSATQDVRVSMVAHAVVAHRLDNGTLEMGSETAAFAYSKASESTLVPASYDFTLQCQCSQVKSSEERPATSSLISATNSKVASTCPNKIASAEKECYNVVASDSTSAGSVCVEVVGNPPAIEVTREVAGDWILLTSEFWFGKSAANVPKKKDGTPNTGKFPYFWCNSTGEVSWTGSAILDDFFDCSDNGEYLVDLVAHSSYMKQYVNGTLIHGSKEASFTYEHSSGSNYNTEFGWIPLRIGCKCTGESLKATSSLFPWMHVSSAPVKHIATSPKLQTHCIAGDNGSGRECHNMMVGDSFPAGSLCVETVDDNQYFEFTFQSTGEWTLLATELWIGDSIDDVPTLEMGNVNNNKFPYFFRNSTGEKTWKTKIALNVSFDCEMIEEFKMAVVASSTFGKVAEDGSLVDDTEVIAFVEDRPDSNMFGWFDLGLRCNCGGTLDSLVGAAKNLLIGDESDKSCASTSIFVDEDFEGEGSEDAWDGGVITTGSDFTYFLGRLGGAYAPQVSRSFPIPTSKDGETKADNLSMEFVLYTIDTWQQNDTVKVLIGTEELDLGSFSSGSSGSGEVSGSREGISWRRNVISQGQNLGFGEAEDEKHLVQIAVSSERFKDDYSLFFGIKVKLNEDAENSAGMDDLMIEAHYSCPTGEHRDLQAEDDTTDAGIIASDSSHAGDSIVSPPNSNVDPTQNHTSTIRMPSTSNTNTTNGNTTAISSASVVEDHDKALHVEKGSYCFAEDFPCGNDNAVYVCHYSRLRGHQTLCIPEQETQILRYYPQDYCGPCVGSVGGSLGGLSWNWS
jgi:hypothetical protein